MNHKIVEVFSFENLRIDFNKNDTIAVGIQKIAKLFPTKKIVWCHLDSKQNLNLETINTVFHHKKMLFSYCPEQTDYFFGKIGYADESPYIKINKEVTFSTWQMSSLVGVVHAETILSIKREIPFDHDFDFYLCSMAKLVMPLGVECFSEPSLLKNIERQPLQKSNNYTLFRFVKQHYKTRWVFLLLFNFIIYERKFPVLSFLVSFFFKRRSNKNTNGTAMTKIFLSSYLPPSAVSQNETSSVKHDVRCRNAPITRRPVPPLLGSEHCLHLAKLKSALC